MLRLLLFAFIGYVIVISFRNLRKIFLEISQFGKSVKRSGEKKIPWEDKDVEDADFEELE